MVSKDNFPFINMQVLMKISQDSEVL